mgnify:CR=1 FL=1
MLTAGGFFSEEIGGNPGKISCRDVFRTNGGSESLR